MKIYDDVAQINSKLIATKYSTSFSAATRLFPADVKKRIYNIYGLVRIADEVVDTYRGEDAAKVLNRLEADTIAAKEKGYSTNPVIHAYQITANEIDIEDKLLGAFFSSMRMDLTKTKFTKAQYDQYIHGSAEVIGLMCLKAFQVGSGDQLHLEAGAKKLGSAFQKVNFLRDFSDDSIRLGRIYFPGVNPKNFRSQDKQLIVKEIEQEFSEAETAIANLPLRVRLPVAIAFNYYYALLKKLKKASIQQLKDSRIRISDFHKFLIIIKTFVSYKRSFKP